MTSVITSSLAFAGSASLAGIPAPGVQGLGSLARDPFVVDGERPDDAIAREALLDRAFGPARFAKTCQKLRVGRRPAEGLSLVARAAEDDVLIGTVRLWHVSAGGAPALMLGPLAVDSRYRCFGIGGRLMESALERAAALGYRAVLLVGDAPYYARFGFERRLASGLRMPGPVEADRFLARELVPGALEGAQGLVRATGALDLEARRTRRAPRLRRAA